MARAELRAVAAFALMSACSGTNATTAASGGDGGAPVSTSGPTSTASTGGAGGRGAIPCNVPYDTFTDGSCDLLQQDCPTGQTCRPVPTNGGGWATQCLSGSGLKGPGDPCSTDYECWPGLFCVGTAPDSVCRYVCCPDMASLPCPEPDSCTLQVQWDAKNWATMCTYAPQCKLLTENACAAGTECHVQNPTTGLADCMTPSDTQVDEGGPCQFLNDCKNMQYCFQNVCRYNCYISANGQGIPGLGGCPQRQKCIDQNINLPDIGVCMP